MKPKSWWQKRVYVDGLKKRTDIAERLKRNKMAFGLLSKAEQKVMREASLDWRHGEKWLTTDCSPDLFPDLTYRVRADFVPQYAPEPEKPCNHQPWPGAFPCALTYGHGGSHVDANGNFWPQMPAAPKPEKPAKVPANWAPPRCVAVPDGDGASCSLCVKHNDKCRDAGGFKWHCLGFDREGGVSVHYIAKPAEPKHSLKWFEEYANNNRWLELLTDAEWQELAALLHEVNLTSQTKGE